MLPIPKNAHGKRSRTHSRTDDLYNLDKITHESDPSSRRTKIVCTLGPSSWDEEMIQKMLEAGMNVARLNFSHGDHETHGRTVQRVRNVLERNPERLCAIMLDTKGPEIRTGFLQNHEPIMIEADQSLKIVTDYTFEGDNTTIACSYKELPTSVKVGGKILIADGSLTCEVTELHEDAVTVKCLNGCKLGERKNMNLPGVKVKLPTVTEKDIDDIQNFALKYNVDMIAASFIRKESDVRYIRQLLGEEGKHIKIVSKIENQEGLENYEGILEASDCIMVARGDMGMEIPPEKVFVAQKMMIHQANIAGKPIITATQMLESMVKNPRPTRAEASDVANAVLDGTDAVMLSGESANGDYPIEAVTVMGRICVEAESCFDYDEHYLKVRNETLIPMSTPEAIASAAVKTSLDMKVGLIIAITSSGKTARLIAKYRPNQRIIALCCDAQLCNNLCLSRGVHVMQVDQFQDTERILNFALNSALEAKWIKKGESVVCVHGSREGVEGASNIMKIVSV